MRDLCADGDIESQPGPRYINKNVNSISGSGKLYQTFRAIREESDRDPITAVFLQDHRLTRAKALQIDRVAKSHCLLAIVAYAPIGADGKGYGDTMIIIPYEAILQIQSGRATRDPNAPHSPRTKRQNALQQQLSKRPRTYTPSVKPYGTPGERCYGGDACQIRWK